MKRKLQFNESLILEEILRDARTIKELNKRLNLNFNLLMNTVNSLVIKQIIYVKDSSYQVNKEELRRYLSDSSSRDISETFEILKSGSYEKNDNLSYQKVYLNQHQMNYLSSLFLNIQDYLKETNQINLKNSNDINLNSKHLIYWGNVCVANITKNLYQ
ncbi:hypothetical protein N9N67_10115 [Bacteriovoracaceae bacterium]|nr:hypothetical protein [Bacteriovoracaceae bacterium]